MVRVLRPLYSTSNLMTRAVKVRKHLLEPAPVQLQR